MSDMVSFFFRLLNYFIKVQSPKWIQPKPTKHKKPSKPDYKKPDMKGIQTNVGLAQQQVRR